jgi:hypothetical protein
VSQSCSNRAYSLFEIATEINHNQMHFFQHEYSHSQQEEKKELSRTFKSLSSIGASPSSNKFKVTTNLEMTLKKVKFDEKECLLMIV